MALSSIALSSRALLKLGADTIASFEEGTAEAEIAANLYPSTRDALLSPIPGVLPPPRPPCPGCRQSLSPILPMPSSYRRIFSAHFPPAPAALAEA